MSLGLRPRYPAGQYAIKTAQTEYMVITIITRFNVHPRENRLPISCYDKKCITHCYNVQLSFRAFIPGASFSLCCLSATTLTGDFTKIRNGSGRRQKIRQRRLPQAINAILHPKCRANRKRKTLRLRCRPIPPEAEFSVHDADASATGRFSVHDADSSPTG